MLNFESSKTKLLLGYCSCPSSLSCLKLLHLILQYVFAFKTLKTRPSITQTKKYKLWIHIRKSTLENFQEFSTTKIKRLLLGLVWQGHNDAESAGPFEPGFGPQGEHAESAGPF